MMSELKLTDITGDRDYIIVAPSSGGAICFDFYEEAKYSGCVYISEDQAKQIIEHLQKEFGL